jgi:streptogramin lyase
MVTDLKEFDVPVSLGGITAGSDGNLWFTEIFGSRIGRITPDGAITEFPLPFGGPPSSIAAGPDGNLWFTLRESTIGRITPDGALTEFHI